MKKISDYLLIGDLHTASLIKSGASIEWLCFPDFDSPTIFASLLDKKTGGRFSVDLKKLKYKSQYINDTAIVETQFFRKQKPCFRINDFFVPKTIDQCSNHLLIRNIKSDLDNLEVSFIYDPKPNYGQNSKIKTETDKLVCDIGEDKLILHLPPSAVVEPEEKGVKIKILLNKNEKTQLALEYITKSKKSEYSFKKNYETEASDFWRKWVNKGKYISFCRDLMKRSAITLKLLQYYPTGALIAAPTTSLPADPKGVRNWDYRYSWIRDATFTLYAFHVLHMDEESEKFFEFIKKIFNECKKNDLEIKTMYDIKGKPAPEETLLKNFSGFNDAKPVRIGNNAAEQFQLDVYGTLLDAHYFLTKRIKEEKTLDKNQIMFLVDKIAKLWNKKDSGIWERRDTDEHFTYSKIMCWVGIDRVLRIADKLKLSHQQKNKCKKLRTQIEEWVWSNCYDRKSKKLVMFPYSEHTDATNFLFVLVQFLNKYEDKTKDIIEKTHKDLSQQKIFIRRYDLDDGIKGKDHAFLLCTFWYISALAIIENPKKARNLFDKFKKNINNALLLPEQMNPDNNQYLGNYPQAFSHQGLIMAAYYIDRYSN